MKNLKFWRQITVGNRYFCIQISENRPTYEDFGFHGVRSPTAPNFKTHKTFVLQRFLLYTYTSIYDLYIILLSRDLKTKKVRHHPHPHPHPHQNKTKISGVKSEILKNIRESNGPLAVRLRSSSQGDNPLVP